MRATRGSMRRDAEMVESGALDPLIVVMRNADEDADVAALLQIENNACVFDGLPCGLQQQPMLRIDVRRFPGRDAEELGIELVDLIQESGAFGESLSGDARLRIVIPLYIPTVGRYVANRVPVFHQQLPERLGVVDAAGKATSNSYDSDTVFLHKG